jgi:hypothetical protein
MIEKAHRHALALVFPRGKSGNAKPRAGGLADFPLTAKARLQLVFDWDDKFVRNDGWPKNEWRHWFKICFERLHKFDTALARYFRMTIGKFVCYGYISLFPRFDVDGIYRKEKEKRNGSVLSERHIKWCALLRVEHISKQPDPPTEIPYSLLINSTDEFTLKNKAGKNPIPYKGRRFRRIETLMEALVEHPQSSVERVGGLSEPAAK